MDPLRSLVDEGKELHHLGVGDISQWGTGAFAFDLSRTWQRRKIGS
jgi:hypothetical protein